MMNELNELKQIADCYATFAADEARGSLEIYEKLAQAVLAALMCWNFLRPYRQKSASPISFSPPSATYLACPTAKASLLTSFVEIMSPS
jgi:hypothetical protein